MRFGKAEFQKALCFEEKDLQKRTGNLTMPCELLRCFDFQTPSQTLLNQHLWDWNPESVLMKTPGDCGTL